MILRTRDTFRMMLAVGTVFILSTAAMSDDAKPAGRKNDCGPRCVWYLARFFDRPITLAQANRECGYTDGNGLIDMLHIRRALESIGFYCYAFHCSGKDMRQPMFEKSGFVVLSHEHYMVVAKAKNGPEWLLLDPSAAEASVISEAVFANPGFAFNAIAVSTQPFVTNGPATSSAPSTQPIAGENPPTQQKAHCAELAAIGIGAVAAAGMLYALRKLRTRRKRMKRLTLATIAFCAAMGVAAIFVLLRHSSKCTPTVEAKEVQAIEVSSPVKQTFDIVLQKDANAELDVGDIPYGHCIEKTLRMLCNDGGAKGISRTYYYGCGACTNTRTSKESARLEDGSYKLVLRFNTRHPHRGELGEYSDAYVVAAEDGVIGRITVKHRTVLSKEVTPNTVAVPELTPPQVVPILLTKNGRFSVKEVEADLPDCRVVDWVGAGDKIRIMLLVGHSYENVIIKGDIKLTSEKSVIFIPAAVKILEDLVITPRNCVLGVVHQGDVISAIVKVSSTRPVNIESCPDGEDGTSWSYSRVDNKNGTLLMRVPIPTEAACGEFYKKLNIPVETEASSVPVEVRAIVVPRSQSPQ